VAKYQFTPAAGRAIQAAATWPGGDSADQISPTELLLGLLSESESRAAEMLAARGVDAAAVQGRWPDLKAEGRRQSAEPKAEGRRQKAETTEEQQPAAFSIELQTALAAASARLAHFPRPLEFATEHLLLGLVAAGDDLANWLGERGFCADELTETICRLYGYSGSGDVEGSGDLEDSGFRVQGSGEGPLTKDSVGNALRGVPELTSAATNQTPRNAREGVPYRGPAQQPQTAMLRLIDAAANRAREGLRVIEDFVRFAWDDRNLMTELKQLRHELAAALARVPIDELLASRDTLGDVGTAVSTTSEAVRPDVLSVVTANFKRLQEALRSIEEFGKVLDAEMAREIEQLRYRSYTLERAVAATLLGLRCLAEARLYVLVDGRDSLDRFADLVRALVSAGVDLLQLRDKQLADRDLLERAHRLREITAGSSTLFIMNDRPDLAALSEADGVHVGQEELSVSACRVIVGPRALIGVSTHSLKQARQAVLDGANYIGVGPTFASRTKSFDAGVLRGTELLRAVNAQIRLPAFAIGGIDGTNLPQVLATGSTRVAVSGAVLDSDDPGKAARDLLTALKHPLTTYPMDQHQ
jgi:thiamine-phosphate pyrophosphorylase